MSQTEGKYSAASLTSMSDFCALKHVNFSCRNAKMNF